MKDPAVLFYTSDFISGTLTMTDSQRGQYILLLCLQHQKGYLTEKDMLNICKSYDEDIWCKFIVIEGKFYNERMKNESEKRKKYSESRRNNRTSKDNKEEEKNNISLSYDKHMENENENIIIDKVYREFKHLNIKYSEIEKLKNLKYSIEQIDDVLNSIENYKKNTNYTSLYLTALKWLKKEYKEVRIKPKLAV